MIQSFDPTGKIEIFDGDLDEGITIEDLEAITAFFTGEELHDLIIGLLKQVGVVGAMEALSKSVTDTQTTTQ